MIRHQPPAYSPLTLESVAKGARAMLTGDASASAELSAKVASLLEARDVLLVDSGTSALSLAIRASAAPASAVAALPAWACYDLATACDGAGARAVLYDVDPSSLAPDSRALAAAARDATAVVIVHLFGLPVPLGDLRSRAGDALIIEDAAQAAGASIDGRAAGGNGDLAVLSFGRGKGLTGGGGGALAAMTDRGRRALDAARGLLGPAAGAAKSLVMLAAQWGLGRPSLYALPASLPFGGLGETVYHPPHPPSAIAPANARVAAENWDAALAEASIRRSNASRLLAAFGPRLSRVTPAPGAEPGYLRLPALLPEGARQRLGADARALGIMPGYPLALADLPGFSRILNPGADFSGARLLASRLVTLPTHRMLEDRDLRALADWANSQT